MVNDPRAKILPDLHLLALDLHLSTIELSEKSDKYCNCLKNRSK